ncbi:hypothetical protein GCN78_17000 [Janthinobacterium rivuli]|uniref:hypothetical protein n=1 Tax=Janthinobacterium sp. FT68W TaxID=2654255 RepID=UPI0012650FDB|nr:hypothetical protein [Janthinobacterium sp. FT68W]KAB8049589.1 hypothetical protein GCN78_17000 [Janthinobacterium sp. FT68W]
MGESESRCLMKIEWTIALPQSGDVPVWVSVAKLEREWQRSKNEYIGAGGDSAMPGKYENFGKWIISASHVEMPEVCIVDGFVRFSNGRHRFAWLRDHGMTTLQVSIQPSDVTSFETKFSSQDQTSQWFKS